MRGVRNRNFKTNCGNNVELKWYIPVRARGQKKIMKKKEERKMYGSRV